MEWQGPHPVWIAPRRFTGMLATVMNAMALSDAFRAVGSMRAFSPRYGSIEVVEPYIRGKAIRYLEEGVSSFGAGTGNPFFTTDTAAAARFGNRRGYRAQGHQVDGIYTRTRRRIRRRPVFSGFPSTRRSPAIWRSWMQPRSLCVAISACRSMSSAFSRVVRCGAS